MQRIIGIVIIIALFWAGHWYWRFDANIAALQNWLGNDAEYDETITQRGFPNRYDTDLTKFAVPAIGLKTVMIQIMGVVYKQDHRIIALPKDIKIFDTVLKTEQLRASIVADGTHLPRITIEAISPEFSNGLRADRAQLSFIATSQDSTFSLFIELNNLGSDKIANPQTQRATLHLTPERALDWSDLGRFIASLETPVSGRGSISDSQNSVTDIIVSGTLRNLQVKAETETSTDKLILLDTLGLK